MLEHNLKGGVLDLLENFDLSAETPDDLAEAQEVDT